jgi:hypothetical protein
MKETQSLPQMRGSFIAVSKRGPYASDVLIKRLQVDAKKREGQSNSASGGIDSAAVALLQQSFKAESSITSPHPLQSGN